MAISANNQLYFHWIPIVIGIILMLPIGEKIGDKFPSLSTKRSRTVGGMIFVMLGGFSVSVHTLYFHNKMLEIGSGADLCAGDGLLDCSSVIGNESWNTVPVLGLPWGIMGMLAFAVMLWIIFSIAKEPAGTFVADLLNYGRMIGILGLFVVLFLMYAEYDIGKICQYCSTAHFAHIVVTIGFFNLNKMHKTSEWGKGYSKSLGDIIETSERKSRRRGYVKPEPIDVIVIEEE